MILPGNSLVLDQSASGNLARIDSLLASLWSDPDNQKKGASHVRACMGNLLVYAEREQDETAIIETISKVMPLHPSRVILMFGSPDGQNEPVDVSVLAQCWLEGDGTGQICCEQIRVKASGSQIDQLPGIVIPLLVPDVPVHLWWRDRFLERQDLFSRFAGDIDNVIFEGLRWTNLIEKVPRVFEIRRRLGDRVAMTNFNWSRLQPWRDRTAQFFDRGMYEDDLEHLYHVNVHYHTPADQQEGRFFQALLFCGWLAGQLGWEIAGSGHRGNKVHLDFKRRDGKTVGVWIAHKVVPGGTTQGIQKVEFEFAHSMREFVFTIEREVQDQLLCMSVRKDGACGLPQKVRHVSAAESTLLLRAMKNTRSGIVFERAFGNAMELLKLGSGAGYE